MSASTNRGTKSEDTNLLFERSKKDNQKLTVQNLVRLVDCIKNCEDIGPFDLSKLFNSHPEIQESNAIAELQDCLRNKDVIQLEVLKLKAIICDIRSGSIWKRVQNAVVYLTGAQTGHLRCNQWKALLWVLIGVKADQVHEEDGNLTFEEFGKKICSHYQRAVDENTPSLRNSSFPSS